jgi:hypothetical protein
MVMGSTLRPGLWLAVYLIQWKLMKPKYKLAILSKICASGPYGEFYTQLPTLSQCATITVLHIACCPGHGSTVNSSLAWNSELLFDDKVMKLYFCKLCDQIDICPLSWY